jgi:hypothetical protein
MSPVDLQLLGQTAAEVRGEQLGLAFDEINLIIDTAAKDVVLAALEQGAVVPQPVQRTLFGVDIDLGLADVQLPPLKIVKAKQVVIAPGDFAIQAVPAAAGAVAVYQLPPAPA